MHPLMAQQLVADRRRDLARDRGRTRVVGRVPSWRRHVGRALVLAGLRLQGARG